MIDWASYFGHYGLRLDDCNFIIWAIYFSTSHIESYDFGHWKLRLAVWNLLFGALFFGLILFWTYGSGPNGFGLMHVLGFSFLEIRLKIWDFKEKIEKI